MNILILTESTGGGHNSCANSIKKAFLKYNADNRVVIASSLNFISPEFAKSVCGLHVFTYRHLPAVFNLIIQGYHNKSPKSVEKRITSGILTSGAKSLYRFIESNDFDLVFCCHPFDADTISRIKRDHPDFKPLTAFLATDYENDLNGDEDNLDYYFIPDESVRKEFTSVMSIPQERVIASGIPVREMFNVTVTKTEAKRQLGLPADCRHLLVMGGSMGVSAISKIVINLSKKRLPSDVHISVICGSNEKMQKQLIKKCSKVDHIHILGFTDNISLYMDSADLYLTKPGGISTAEAKVKCLPTVLVDVVGGFEGANMRYLTALGLARTAEKTEELTNLCLSLLGDEKALSEMATSAFRSEDIPATDIICATLFGSKNQFFDFGQ